MELVVNSYLRDRVLRALDRVSRAKLKDERWASDRIIRIFDSAEFRHISLKFQEIFARIHSKCRNSIAFIIF